METIIMEHNEYLGLVGELAKAGWYIGGKTVYPNGVAVHLRPAPETSGEPIRSIFGEDEEDAISRELKRLEKSDDA
jgi:hypothetical protein